MYKKYIRLYKCNILYIFNFSSWKVLSFKVIHFKTLVRLALYWIWASHHKHCLTTCQVKNSLTFKNTLSNSSMKPVWSGLFEPNITIIIQHTVCYKPMEINGVAVILLGISSKNLSPWQTTLANKVDHTSECADQLRWPHGRILPPIFCFSFKMEAAFINERRNI